MKCNVCGDMGMTDGVCGECHHSEVRALEADLQHIEAEAPSISEFIRERADRGRLLGTLSPATLAELEDLAKELES